MTAQSPQVSVTAGHQDMANAIRFLAVDAIEKAKSGHPGMPLGMADVATVLFSRFLKLDPKNPKWFNRDRFVLSAGHGSMLLYALAYLTGFEDCDIEQIKSFRQMGARTAGHPEFGHIAIADTTTGPLGQGIGNAVGFALAEKIMAARWGAEACDHYTYVIAGDGCLMEGLSQEAISLAGHWQLNKLIVLWDDNHICIDGDTALSTSENQALRFQASGWNTLAVDGHDPDAVAKAIEQARASDKPTMIACRTVIGFGSAKAGTEKVHGAALGAADIEAMRAKLDWPYPAFEVPKHILQAWRDATTAGIEAQRAWVKRLEALPVETRQEFERTIAGELPAGWDLAINAYKAKISAEQPDMATRKASQEVLNVLQPLIPELIGGSADLTHSNLTNTKVSKPISRADFSGNYIHYGVREHGMGAVMNGLALHGGLIPYGGTFFVFSDYLRPSLRMSALMGQRVVYVFTHDSIGLGEDGPTHQPIEHLASLRAMPNLLVFRPCDAVETAEAYEFALANKDGPSALALSRHNVPTLRQDHSQHNLVAQGGYVLAEPNLPRQVTILATGTEVAVALVAQAALHELGIATAVVSMPCWELFDRQPTNVRNEVLGKDSLRIAIEAGSTFGWERYTGEKGAIVGMKSFGASAPAEELYAYFDITAKSVVEIAVARLGL
jgi:transketolase